MRSTPASQDDARRISLRLAVLNRVLRRVVRPLLDRTRTPEAARRDLELACRIFLHGPRHNERKIVLGGVPTLEILPRRVTGEGVILFLHGGGYVAGSPRTHRAMMARLADLSGRRVLMPDYRLAPEHPFPAAFDDALRAARALSGTPWVIGGDSAGGGLALAVRAALDPDDAPRGAFAFSPWTDLTLTGQSLDANAERDWLLPADRAGELVNLVMAEADPSDPRVSPLFAQVGAGAPVLLQVSETEILRDDTMRLADRLREAGTDVTVETWPDAPHVWQMLDGWVPEAREALRHVAAFVETRLSLPRSGSGS